MVFCRTSEFLGSTAVTGNRDEMQSRVYLTGSMLSSAIVRTQTGNRIHNSRRVVSPLIPRAFEVRTQTLTIVIIISGFVQIVFKITHYNQRDLPDM